MPDKIILAIQITEFHALNKRHHQQDIDGTIKGIWNDYKDRELTCFHCNGLVEFPVPYTELTAAPDNLQTVIAAPLCFACSQYTRDARWQKTRTRIERLYTDGFGNWRLIPYARSFVKYKIRRGALA